MPHYQTPYPATLEEHDGKVSISSRNVTNLRFTDAIHVDALAEEAGTTNPGSEVIKLFSYSTQLSMKF